MIAFEKFIEIDKLQTLQEKHKHWLKDYVGKKYGKGLNGKMIKGFKWTETSYSNEKFETDINYCGRLKNRLVIEFDGDSNKAKEYLNETEEKLKELKCGYIRSTHKGKSDYLWVEFTKDIKQKEAEKFLYWIAPEGSEVDLNFSSLRKIFPVLFAVHGKHSMNREMPIKFNEGEKIDIDKLGIIFMPSPLKKNVKGYITSIKTNSKIFTRRGQIENFYEEQPFFYDNSKMFWLWDNKEKRWVLSDEIDFLNLIQELFGIETIDSKAKSELISGFQQIGRKHHPKPMKKSWVQFKEKIYDLINDKSFDATPEYFSTNPIPYNVGENDNTPNIDKLFIEWVGEEYKETLYEIIAYNISLDKFMQRIIALCGGGSNGKGTFIKLNYKFLGKDNCVSSEIKSLSENVFETAVLYRKLLCVMGEVSYGDLKNTNQLKKLGGEDSISFQFKGKTPFTDDNTATCICLTNSLPQTPDKSIGFYRKWLIIDFPNQFKGINRELIESIPEKEFENLAFKCLNKLKLLYKTKKFTNEGDFDERMRRYEERSNPVLSFIDERCEEKIGSLIPLREFTNTLNEFLRSKHLRILGSVQVGKVLRNEGFLVGNRKINGISSVVILNLEIILEKKLSKLSKLSKLRFTPYEASNMILDSSNSSNSSQRELTKFKSLNTPNETTFLCQDSTSIIILKNNEPVNLQLEKGKKYSISYFGDESEKITKILQKEGKIKLM